MHINKNILFCRKLIDRVRVDLQEIFDLIVGSDWARYNDDTADQVCLVIFRLGDLLDEACHVLDEAILTSGSDEDQEAKRRVF